eukprot:g4046.t1
MQRRQVRATPYRDVHLERSSVRTRNVFSNTEEQFFPLSGKADDNSVTGPEIVKTDSTCFLRTSTITEPTSQHYYQIELQFKIENLYGQVCLELYMPNPDDTGNDDYLFAIIKFTPGTVNDGEVYYKGSSTNPKLALIQQTTIPNASVVVAPNYYNSANNTQDATLICDQVFKGPYGNMYIVSSQTWADDKDATEDVYNLYKTSGIIEGERPLLRYKYICFE